MITRFQQRYSQLYHNGFVDNTTYQYLCWYRYYYSYRDPYEYFGRYKYLHPKFVKYFNNWVFRYLSTRIHMLSDTWSLSHSDTSIPCYLGFLMFRCISIYLYIWHLSAWIYGCLHTWLYTGNYNYSNTRGFIYIYICVCVIHLVNNAILLQYVRMYEYIR